MSLPSVDRREPKSTDDSGASPPPPTHVARHRHRAGLRRDLSSSQKIPSPLRTALYVASLILIGYAAVSIGTVIFGGGGATAPTHAVTFHGAYVAATTTADLASRDATSFSRASVRPATLPGVIRSPKTKTKTQHRLVAQYALLRRAAANAEKYAKRLSSQEWVYPTSDFRVTELFGVPGPHWSSGYHTGIDFATAYGTPVVAVGNGTIAQTGWDGPYGNQIRLQLPNGDQVWYNHLSSIEVTPGQPVLKGQELGRVGDTGNAFGYHLHLEYRLASDLATPVDPLPFFREHGLRLR